MDPLFLLQVKAKNFFGLVRSEQRIAGLLAKRLEILDGTGISRDDF